MIINMLKSNSLLILFVFLFLGIQVTAQETPVIKTVDKSVCKKEMAQSTFKVLDVRTPEEFEKGHIEGAENINFYDADFKSKLEEIDKSAKIIVYCAVGGRSHKALKMMEKMGFSYVLEVKGGYNEWTKE